MKSSGKRKLSLMWTIISSIAMVGTASVATFAWFQASAAAEVHTASTSTTITTSKPDDYEFYYYNKNKLDTYNSPNGTYANDFELVTSSNISTVTNMDGMYPGQKLTFCVKLSGKTVDADSVQLKITHITSNTTVQESIAQRRVIRTGSYANMDINIGWAMNIYSTVLGTNNSTVPAYSTFITSPSGDKFTHSPSNNSTYLAGSKSGNIIELTTPISVVSSTTATHSNMYLMYTIEFSNANTTYYKEVNSSGTDLPVPPDSGTRYFDSNTSGTSNCYAGLSFQLNTLSLD